jgi:hypothetical protein
VIFILSIIILLFPGVKFEMSYLIMPVLELYCLKLGSHAMTLDDKVYKTCKAK